MSYSRRRFPRRATLSDRLGTRGCVLVASLFLSLVVAPAFGQVAEIRLLYDTSTPMPGAPGGVLFGGTLPFIEPMLVEGDLYFVGQGPPISWAGIYRDRGDGLEKVVDWGDLIPGSSLTFGAFGSIAADGDALVFAGGRGNPDRYGVFRVEGEGIQVVADLDTPIPGQGASPFRSFGSVAVHGDEVLFAGGATQHFFSHQDGLYRFDGVALSTVVDASTSIPGGAGTFDLIGKVIMDANGFTFTRPRVNSSVSRGIYGDFGSGLEKVVDEATAIPGQAGTFDNIRVHAYENGVTAFVGKNAASFGGVYRAQDGLLDLVADTTTLVPGTPYPFANTSNRVAYADGRVVMMAFHNPPPSGPSRVGLYVTVGGTLHRILEVDDVFDGGVVDRLGLASGAADGDRIVITVYFTSGRVGLYEVRLSLFADDFESGGTMAWTSTKP